MNRISKILIKGKRIYLRKVQLSDVTDRYVNWMNDPEVNEYLETRFSLQTHETISSYVREIEEDANTVFMAIVLKSINTHIGNIKIGPINPFHHFADLSLIIGEKTHWAQGYGSEAIGLAVEYAFDVLNLHKLSAGFYAGNIGSIKAFKKNGFVEEGLRKKHRFFQNRYVDEVSMGKIRPD